MDLNGRKNAADELIAMCRKKATRRPAAEALMDFADIRGLVPLMTDEYHRLVEDGKRWRVPFICYRLRGLTYDSDLAGRMLNSKIAGIRIFGGEWAVRNKGENHRARMEEIIKKDPLKWVRDEMKRTLKVLDP